MNLCELLQATDGVLLQGDARADVQTLCYDSRAVTPGALFVCLPGLHTDGHAYAVRAAAAGAVGIVCERPIPGLPEALPVIQVTHSRRALAQLAIRLYGEPARQLTMIGITGTKGKTTTAHLVAAVLTAAGRKVGLIGTNGVRWPGYRHPLDHTTPESSDLQQLLRRMVDAGCDTCVMEVSSLGLKMDRVTGIEYDIGIFTNLSPDHIGPGEHASFAEYRAWKSVLFRRCRVGIVNADDPQTEAILTQHTCRVVTYGMDRPADWRAGTDFTLLHRPGLLGVTFTAAGPEGGSREYQLAMPGRFSIYNALAAIAAAGILQLPDTAVQTGLRTAVVEGRVEPVPIHAPFTVVLDYAHNEAAAENLLTTLRAYRPTRLIVVFGCGGGRSRVRRFGMGEACARLADFCIVTEDNSRGEPLADILADIRTGLRRGNPDTPFVEISDRRQALYDALDMARPGDIVAVIGKGHETTLQRGSETIPFCEREIIRNYMAGRRT
ncbi:UDP-N-acetylmuramoyl-L-alanyl-D-glutamate--2,6-diaminopimelate ligase [Subdoligranulum variabile]|uniref:UDP-N-acetylmuramyl-tripeptide synthetase n=1 Tax=Subdoligranulum variabile DSM 15176 TaxID=411471 RepID=D1PIW5_9FIRM|nr:UDP-N-acetylmuramoyl-L-alanyl-D-glutamate--2,6-diaminopimelate ligase [Subdoligranulum variabile]EFB77474.1 UDP-N-acetylmuramoyl-L-alanyl-D-glutamate--2,6-diaminopimelate ligase [Subdoligranulum variabile DSM 15176]UWP67358.1 UDP-N-acetylmuramoyl-L-alanyl-D-glutamate--2,6-diaminopimelate ligase [Subdoligranulum variabile]